jgi:hypothetical protein
LTANAARRINKELHLWVNHWASADRRIVVEQPCTPVVVWFVFVIHWLIHVIEGVILVHTASSYLMKTPCGCTAMP